MHLTMYQVDAFTNERFKGNSAAVLELERWLDDATMQNIAIENNLSETVFFVKQTDGSYHIRWFSPLCEIDFCGHATLASAFVLFKQNPSVDLLSFEADAIGAFTVSRGENGFINMTFDTQAPEPVIDIPDTLLNGVGIKPVNVLRNRQAYFVVYDDSKVVRSLKPNLETLKQLAPFDVVITAPDQQYDFISRYFWPANGGDEDPVTGSIHCGLAPYWGQRLNKNNLVAYQASSRGGVIHCALANEKITLSGQAILYMTATIEI